MSPAVRRGLQLAKDLLRRELYVAKGGEMSEREEKDLHATIKWIAHQEAIDDKRRKPRGEYRRSRT